MSCLIQVFDYGSTETQSRSLPMSLLTPVVATGTYKVSFYANPRTSTSPLGPVLGMVSDEMYSEI